MKRIYSIALIALIVLTGCTKEDSDCGYVNGNLVCRDVIYPDSQSNDLEIDDFDTTDDKGKGTIIVTRDYSFGFPLATRNDKTEYQFEFGNPEETKYKVRVPAGKYTIQIVTANREIYQIPIIVRPGSRTILGWNEF